MQQSVNPSAIFVVLLVSTLAGQCDVSLQPDVENVLRSKTPPLRPVP